MKPKLVEIHLEAIKEAVQMLDRLEKLSCKGCSDDYRHDDSCPAKDVAELRNYFRQRVNNPTRNYGR